MTQPPRTWFSTPPHKPLGLVELVFLLALTTSLTAMSIDAMLPALADIAEDLRLTDPNQRWLVVVAFFLGFSCGPLPFGVLADARGRRAALFAGLGVFFVGVGLCALAETFDGLLVGRLLMGVGAASPRSVATSVMRDLYAGRELARVNAFVMTAFVLTPIIAPTLGYVVWRLIDWRSIFWMVGLQGVIVAIWYGLRMPETLRREHRRAASLRNVLEAMQHAFGSRLTLAPMLATGVIFGAFAAFLGLAEPILGEYYGLGDQFAFVFALHGVVAAAALFSSGLLVRRLGPVLLIETAAVVLICASAIALIWGAANGPLSLTLFIAWVMVMIAAFSWITPNLQSLAMEPLGARAGSGAAIVLTVNNGLGALGGYRIGLAYDGPPTPVIAGFGAAAVIVLVLTRLRGGEDMALQNQA